jgi:hypothetical protein
MAAPARGSARSRSRVALAIAVAGVLLASATASAFNSAWSKPQRVFTSPSVPSQDMVTDAAGNVHVASDRGGDGVWYITNKGGAWSQCQISTGDDRQPSIAVDGGTVHVAFARTSGGAEGIYTASSDQPAGGSGCGWALTQRHAGGASASSLRARGGVLSIAYRTDDHKLRFTRGEAADADWTVQEVIDASCCTSPVSLALTTTGAARVAYGDGASRAQGLKFAVRSASGWRAAKAHGGRVTQVAMVLDQMGGLFGEPPSNAPSIAFVVARKGAYLATKGRDGTAGSWDGRFIAKAFGALDLTKASNVTRIVYTRKGDLLYTRMSGGIWVGSTLSGTGREGQPRLSAGQLTFTRTGSGAGIYITHGG